MAVSKCYLCNGRLRGGDWKYKEVDGKPRKVCVDERSCKLRKAMHEKIAETAEDEKGDGGGVSYTGVAVVTALEIICFGVGIVVGMLLC